MTKHLSVSRFSRLFQNVTAPVYVLDETQTLIYFNSALTKLTQCEEEKLMGQVCRYHASSSRLHHEIIAAGLAPPPETLEGKKSVGVVSIDAVHSFHHRLAEFLPLPMGENSFGLFVRIASEDISAEEAACFFSSQPSERVETGRAKELHRLLFALRRHQAGQYRLDRLIGDTPAVTLAREQAKFAMGTSTPVLILGPNGSGRESLAEAIHFGHDRDQSGGLIPVDCHVLSMELIESTIRAFYNRYGKSTDKKCHTLLLSEVDKINPELGPLVCSLVNNNPGNMRVIGTSSVPTDQWKGLQKLSTTLAVVMIHLPPLVQRLKDLPFLAQLFLEQHNAREKTQKTGFSMDALDLLALYHWPGNLDELAIVVSEARETSKETLIRASDVPARLHHGYQAKTVSVKEKPIDLEKHLRDIELDLITKALKTSHGNKAKAARLLGVTRPRLYRRMEQLGLVVPPTLDFKSIDEETE